MIHRRPIVLQARAGCPLLLAGPAIAQPKRYPTSRSKIIVGLPGRRQRRHDRAHARPEAVGVHGANLVGTTAPVDQPDRYALPAVAKAAPDGHTPDRVAGPFLTTNSIFATLSYDLPRLTSCRSRAWSTSPGADRPGDKQQKYPMWRRCWRPPAPSPARSPASSGDGSPQHLAGLLFEARTQNAAAHVPGGGALAINDTLAGRHGGCDVRRDARGSCPMCSRQLHALGVLSPTRLRVPQVPTMAESGIASSNCPPDAPAGAGQDPAPHHRPVAARRAERLRRGSRRPLVESGIEVAIRARPRGATPSSSARSRSMPT